MEDFSSWTDDDWFDSDYMDEEDYRSVHGDSAIGDFSWGAGDSMWNTPATDGGWIAQTQPGLLSNPTAEESQILSRIKTDPSYASTMQMLGQQKAAAERQQSLDRLKSIDVAENNLQSSGWNDMTAPRAEGPISNVHVNYSMPNLQAAQVAHEEEWADTDHFGNPLSTDQFGNYNFDTQQQQYLNAKNSNVFSPDELAEEDINLWQALGEKDPTLSATEKFWKDRAIKAESPLKGVREFVRGTVGGPAINAYNNMMGVAESTKAYDPSEAVQGQMPSNIGSDIANIGTGIIDAISNPLAVAEEVASLASGGLQHVVGDDYAWNLEDKEKAAQFGQSIIDTYGSVEGWKQEFAERPVSTIAMATGAGILGKAVGQGLLKAADPETVDKVMGNIPGLMAEPKKELITYHGSPHKFDKFDHEKMGSGEGAQSYGWGTYLAEHPETAKTYTPRDFDMEDELLKLYDKAQDYRAGTDNTIDLQVYESALLHESPKDIMDYMREAYEGRDIDIARAQTAVDKYQELYDEANFNFYEVDLPDKHIATMIDYDAPLSKQNNNIKNILKEEFTNFDDASQRYNTIQKRLDELDSQGKLDTNEWKGLVKESQQIRGDLGINPSAEGYEIYNHFVNKFDSPQKASEYLDSKGVKGIQFFDQQSRTAEDGTRNFVVFNQDTAKVLKRNDKDVSPDNYLNAVAPIGTMGITEGSMTEAMLGTQNVSDSLMHAIENISPENITTREQGLIGAEDMTEAELDEYIKGLLSNIR